MRQYYRPTSEWLSIAMRLARDGGYDTFGFQANFALFLGNYNPMLKYDKYGSYVPQNSQTACSAFGTGMVNRVYSTVAPNTPTTMPTINSSLSHSSNSKSSQTTYSSVMKASDWLNKKF
jgi:hypothetical protein